MTLATVNSPVFAYPGLTTFGSTAPALSVADTLDAAGEATVWCGIAPFDMSVSHVYLKLSAATGSPTGIIRIETLTAGDPSGTLVTASGELDPAPSAGALTTTGTVHALGATVNLTRGQPFCVKISLKTGTSFVVNILTGLWPNHGTPYRNTNISGSYVAAALNNLCIALGSSSSVFYSLPGMLPCASVAQNSFSNSASGRRGIEFQLPFRAKARGLMYYMGTATGSFDYGIWDASNAEVGSSKTSFNGTDHAKIASSLGKLYFDTAPTLEANTTYYAAIEPTSVTNCNMYTAALGSANYRSAWPGGNNFHYVTYVPSTWTSDTSSVPFMELLLEQLSDDAGSGGVVARTIGG